MAKKKEAKKPTGKVDKDWEALKKAFSEAGKKAGEKFYQDGKNEILYEADQEAKEMRRLREEERG